MSRRCGSARRGPAGCATRGRAGPQLSRSSAPVDEDDVEPCAPTSWRMVDGQLDDSNGTRTKRRPERGSANDGGRPSRCAVAPGVRASRECGRVEQLGCARAREDECSESCGSESAVHREYRADVCSPVRSGPTSVSCRGGEGIAQPGLRPLLARGGGWPSVVRSRQDACDRVVTDRGLRVGLRRRSKSRRSAGVNMRRCQALRCEGLVPWP